jgi:hypothetical protein
VVLSVVDGAGSAGRDVTEAVGLGVLLPLVGGVCCGNDAVGTGEADLGVFIADGASEDSKFDAAGAGIPPDRLSWFGFNNITGAV